MTEKSYFWNHGVGGDATYSPYDSAEFNAWFFNAFAGDFSFLTDTGNNIGPFVIPGYLNDLTVDSAGQSLYAVKIDTGAAVINNQLYINDSVYTLNIDRAGSGYYRRDVVVLRLNVVTGKIRIGVVKGIETSSFPVEPALTQTAAVWEMPLAAVYVNSSHVYINTIYIYDRRKFMPTYATRARQPVPPPNLILNSEWLALKSGIASGWFSTTANVAHGAPASNLLGGRGQTVDIGTAASTDVVWQWIPATTNKTFSFRVRLRTRDDIPATGSEAFSVFILGHRLDQVLDSIVTTEALCEFGEAYENIAVSTTLDVNFTCTVPDNVEVIRLLFFKTGSFTSIEVYQPLLCEGYHTGYDRPVHETIMLESAITDASWSLTAKSTSTTTIDLTASFSGLVLPHVKAVILRLRGRDSGSAAAVSCVLRATGYAAPYSAVYGSLELNGVPNDVIRETMCIVPIDQVYTKTGVAGASFRLSVVATGAGTFDADVSICGIIT